MKKTRLVTILVLVQSTIFSNSSIAADNLSSETGDSLFQTAVQGGFMMVPLLLLALVSLTIIIERILFYFKNKSWDQAKISEHLNICATDSKAKFKEELEDELRDNVKIYLNKMEKGIVLLNGIGNLAPLVGFFGTVIGMIKAFAAIAAATTVNAKVVAVGIQVALVTTAGGLSVAVPTLAFFYIFIHLIQKISAQSDEVIKYLCRDLPSLPG